MISVGYGRILQLTDENLKTNRSARLSHVPACSQEGCFSDGWIFFEEGKNVRPILVGLFVHIRP